MTSVHSFTPPYPLTSAILFLVFNRIDTTKQVFQAIRQAKPPKLYIASDGARDDKDGELEKINAIRDYLMNNIDWPCDVKTLFREKNLGCKHSVSSAVSWFFDNEEQGIILEDDCLPSQSFFWFCEELLDRYKTETSIAQISGTNALLGNAFTDNSYYFSRFNNPVWGWASWRRAWAEYDIKMTRWGEEKKSNWLLEMMDDKYQARYWTNAFDDTKAGLIDTWDYQWTFNCLDKKRLTIIPSVNLIANIGFGPDATHTTDVNSQVNQYENMDVFTIEAKLSHPEKIERCMDADSYIQRTWFTTGTLSQRIVNKIKRLSKSLKINNK